jgi:O-antigen ligase
LTVCSALWSQNPIRSATFGLLYLVDTLFAFYLAANFDQEQLREIAMLGGLTISVLCLMMVFFFPQFATSHTVRDAISWNGIFEARTSSAKYLTFLLSPAIGFGRRTFSYGRVAYVLLLLFLIVKAHAVSALIVLFLYISAVLALYLFKRLEAKAFIVVAALTFAAVLLLVFVGAPFLPALFALFGRDTSLTGRTVVWNAVIHSILKRPLLGYGFYAFWLGLKGESANIIVATHWVFGYAHNGILEIFLQLGLVGVAVFFLSFVQALRNAWLCLRSGRSTDVEWYIGILILTILYNVDEATVVWPNDLLSILYVVACCGLAKVARGSNQNRKLGASIR